MKVELEGRQIPDPPGLGLIEHPEEHSRRGQGVTMGPVAGMNGDVEVLAKGIQVPSPEARGKTAGHLNGADSWPVGHETQGIAELGLDERPIEADVVSHENPAIQPGEQVFGDVLKEGGVFHHLGSDSREVGDPLGNRPARVDQGLEILCDETVIDGYDGDLRDPMSPVRRPARGLDIDNRVGESLEVLFGLWGLPHQRPASPPVDLKPGIRSQEGKNGRRCRAGVAGQTEDFSGKIQGMDLAILQEGHRPSNQGWFVSHVASW